MLAKTATHMEHNIRGLSASAFSTNPILMKSQRQNQVGVARDVTRRTTAFSTPFQLHGSRLRRRVCPLRRRVTANARLIPLTTGVNMEVLEVPAEHPVSAIGSEQPQKPPLIFIHGSLHGAWCFQFFQPFFARHGFTSYAVSLRGAGKSEVEQTTNPTVQEHISDLSSFLASLNPSIPPVIVGHSMGGFIAQKWVEQETSRPFAGMVLLTSTPPSGNSELARRTMARIGWWKSIRITLGFVLRSVTKDVALCREMFFSPKDSQHFSEDIEGDERLWEYMERFKETSLTLDIKSLKPPVEATGNVAGKVLVIGSNTDPLVDETALEESAQFWSGDLHVIKDAPHDMILYSKWENTASLMLDWLNRRISSELLVSLESR